MKTSNKTLGKNVIKTSKNNFGKKFDQTFSKTKLWAKI